MKIDPLAGNLELQGTFGIVGPGLTLANFIASPLGEVATLDVQNNQYATYSVLVKESQEEFGISFVFKAQKLESLRIEKIDTAYSWSNWTEEIEAQRKLEHERLLTRILGSQPYLFPWGEAGSSLDPRSGSANIWIRYNP